MKDWPESAPPVVSESPVWQTAWWLARPMKFLDHCRRHYGHDFMVRFVGSEVPLAFLSHPDAVRALYTNAQNPATPARLLRIGPVLGLDSVLVGSGPEQLKRRKIVAPCFHGDRLRYS
jgi:cytochrome P450